MSTKSNIEKMKSSVNSINLISAIIQCVFGIACIVAIIFAITTTSEYSLSHSYGLLVFLLKCFFGIMIGVVGWVISSFINVLSNMLLCQIKIEEHNKLIEENTRVTANYLHKIYNQQAS